MRILALITRPWCELVRISGVIPRVLADDLMMLAIQQQAAWRTARALLDSHGFIIAMGGQVRVSKTWTFASGRDGRNILKLLTLPGQEDELVTVVFEHRDLGGHLDATARRTGTTLTQRLVKTTGQCKAHARTPGGFTQRYRLVMGKYLPMSSTSFQRLSLVCLWDDHKRGTTPGVPSSLPFAHTSLGLSRLRIRSMLSLLDERLICEGHGSSCRTSGPRSSTFFRNTTTAAWEEHFWRMQLLH